MTSVVLVIAPERIALFKAIVESYDNLVTMRTEDPQRHHLRLYFSPESEEDVEALLGSLEHEFGFTRLAG